MILSTQVPGTTGGTEPGVVYQPEASFSPFRQSLPVVVRLRWLIISNLRSSSCRCTPPGKSALAHRLAFLSACLAEGTETRELPGASPARPQPELSVGHRRFLCSGCRACRGQRLRPRTRSEFGVYCRVLESCRELEGKSKDGKDGKGKAAGHPLSFAWRLSHSGLHVFSKYILYRRARAIFGPSAGETLRSAGGLGPADFSPGCAERLTVRRTRARRARQGRETGSLGARPQFWSGNFALRGRAAGLRVPWASVGEKTTKPRDSEGRLSTGKAAAPADCGPKQRGTEEKDPLQGRS